jgi:hypothetical protein
MHTCVVSLIPIRSQRRYAGSTKKGCRMKVWLVHVNDSYLWFPSQDEAEGYAHTLIAGFAEQSDGQLTIEKYFSAGSGFDSLAAILNGHCKVRRVFHWRRQNGKTVFYSRANKEIRVSAYKPNHPTAEHAAAVEAVLNDPALLELTTRANNHTEWILFTSTSEILPRRLATYVWFYIKGKNIG